MEKTAKEAALDCIRKEAEFLQEFSNEKIVKFRFFWEYASHIVLGMELCKGGSLWELIRKRWDNGESFTDDEAATIVKSIL